MATDVSRPASLNNLPSTESSTPLLRRPPRSIASSTLSSSTSSSTRRNYNTIRAISFAISVLAALCGNSISVFSLYAPVLQHRLRYTQYQVNGLANAASCTLYFPVPIFGYICDRFGPAPLSAIAATCLGLGYGVAAFLFHYVDAGAEDVSWTFGVMVACFLAIGTGTCCIYLGAVAVTAKNFGKGKYRGLMLAIPITCFGLSGMWLSQFGSLVLCERNVDGTCGDVDPYAFFSFLAVLLATVGILAIFLLRVVNEENLIEEAVEELANSGILDGSALLSRHNSTYGTLPQAPRNEDTVVTTEALLGDIAKDPTDEEDAQWKKEFLLNAETRRFLSDYTMWWLALGFFLIIGPGEAFVNNMGTVINTLYNPSAVRVSLPPPTSPATHVSIVAFTSTAARILTGTLSDLLAPKTTTDHPQVPAPSPHRNRRDGEYSVSRVSFLIFFAGAMSVGFLTQASGLVQDHGERFWVVSSFIGLGYGGVFSITPIIITVIWGVENFATNWGIVAMFPAVGSVFWGLVYSAVYTSGAKENGSGSGTGEDGIVGVHKEAGNGEGGNATGDELFCYGTQCYALSFWAMTISIWVGSAMVLWAWKGKNGWVSKQVVV